MTKQKLEKDIILKRLAGIENELSELQKLSKENLGDFKKGSGWKLAQFHLHRALEGVFNIGNHIVSRIPGSVATQYKEVALKLGENNIVTKDFAQEKLVKMAKYRNRLVHFYAEITTDELYNILQNDLADFEVFLKSVKTLLQNPTKYNLEVE